MKDGLLPPETSSPSRNKSFEIIDTKLTTEIFGLFAPPRPNIVVKIAHLSIKFSVREEAQEISKLYTRIHALSALNTEKQCPRG